MQGFALDDDEEIEAAAHEVDGAYFFKAIDALGDGVKADFSLGRKVDFDDGIDAVVTEFLPVDQGVVTQDDLILFKPFDFFFYFILAFLEYGGDFADGTSGVVL